MTTPSLPPNASHTPDRAPRAVEDVAAFAHELSIPVHRATRALASLGPEDSPNGRAAHAALTEALAAIRGQIDEAMRAAVRSTLAAEPPSRLTTMPATEPVASERVGDVMRRVMAALEPLAASTSVALRVECEGDAMNVPAGPLELVLTNTIRNAIESCARVACRSSDDEPRTVTVALRRRGSRLVVDVVDNGAGLGGFLGTRFDTTTESGHGLGLSIVRRVLASVGGSMELTNVPFGRGAVFCADVPISRLSNRLAA
ncbi:MAG: HAMP domain-containing histidine kinase [Phycisphaerae bacterium]|nr:HAMP domain-containing histidine kinase [Phycisphaerae bacterium]